ncbi:MAG: AAA family ATPase [Deltaproteobacteria bacterium]|nr:AAA family ATPase [Deltaproteobacteria bacterium]
MAEVLFLTILYESDSQELVSPELLETIPKLRVLEHRTDPEGFLSEPGSVKPDLILVVLKGEAVLPDWLEKLLQFYPSDAIIVSSASRHPDFLIRIMQLGIREFLPLPLNPMDLKAAIERVRAALKEKKSTETRRGQMVVVTSHKGGVGATAIAINLAMALAELHPQRVVLVDLGRPFPDVAHFLNLQGSYSITDLLQNVNQLDPLFVRKVLQQHEGNLYIVSGNPDLNGQQTFEPERLEKLFSELRNLYDWLVVDLSNWIDNIFFMAIREADQVLLLTELSIPDLKNLKNLCEVLYQRNLSIQKVKVLVNRYYKHSPLELKDIERLLHKPVSFTLPSDYPAMIAAIDQGTSLPSVAPRSKLWRSLKLLAKELDSESRSKDVKEAAKPGWLRRIFSKEVTE